MRLALLLTAVRPTLGVLLRGEKGTAKSTAGVEGNAGRAGDPAGNYEYDGRYERVTSPGQPLVGTINTLLLLNVPLVEGALVRSVITATETKTTVLQDLAVGSKYSRGRATGTGTDQIAMAAPLPADLAPTPLRSTGHHVVSGELISEAVAASVRDALVLQNGLVPSAQRSVCAQLGRYGITTELRERCATHAPDLDRLVPAALCLGYAEKWRDLHRAAGLHRAAPDRADQEPEASHG